MRWASAPSSSCPSRAAPGRWARSCSSRPSRGGSSTTTTCCSRASSAVAPGRAIENARLYQAVEQRARAAEALEFVGDGVLLVDRDGIVRIWNPQAEAITGLAVRDVEGLPAAEAIPGWEELVRARPGRRRRRRPAEPEPGRPVHGRGRRALARRSPASRFPDGTVYAFRDITEERGLEQMKSDFVSTVSHELRTPLAAIYGAALTLRRADMPLPDDQRQRAARRDLGRGRPARAHRQRHPLDEPDRVGGHAGARSRAATPRSSRRASSRPRGSTSRPASPST